MFEQLKLKVQERFAELLANGSLFQVELDRDKVWELYLAAIPEEHRPSNVCNCCKSFLRQFGGVVGVGPHNTVLTLWDFDLDHDEEYGQAVKAMRRYVASLPITGLFFNPFPKCGTAKNFDPVRAVTWTHFNFELPRALVKSDDVANPIIGEKRESKNVLLRSVNELTPNSVETVLDLIGQGSLYRGSEFKGIVEKFQKIQKAALAVPAPLRENYCWKIASDDGGATSRIRNSSIGTLLIDLSEGKDLDAAVRSFERVVAPANYKRPTALVTPHMIEEARTRLQELGLTGALQRRLLNDRDLTAANALHVFRKRGAATGDIFDQLKADAPINPRSLSKVEEISIDDFIANVLPTAKSVRALVENSHLSNLVSLVGPVEAGPTLFKWENNFSWSYVGEVADSIKERVKAAGGNVQGFLRISLSWNNKDDLDLHLTEPDGHKIMFQERRQLSRCGGMLDLDANGMDGMRDDPAENIIYVYEPKVGGLFKVVVHQYANRAGGTNTGFELEIECEGQVFSFSELQNGPTNRFHNVAEFTYTKKDGFSLTGATGKLGVYPSKEKWNIKTGLFHPVKAITLSPNHWTTATGNKHVFFLLEGAKNEDRIRPFYNEFLKPELDKDRKVFEILGSKINVEPTENELSGLGFSETVRNHLFVEVESTFKRTLKIKF